MRKPITLLHLFLLLLCFSCKQSGEPSDKVIIDRLCYVYNIKSVVNNKIWKGFDDNKYDVPLIYYGDSSCYVVNPTEKFMNQYNPEFIFGDAAIKIYKTPLLDSIPFHMHVSVSFENEANFDFRSPFMRCSNTEATTKIVPDVPSTEVWTTMIMHEYFHGFQFKHSGYLDYFEGIEMTQDTLKSLYLQNSWFKESIDRENDMLLSAIASEDIAQIQLFVNSFFELREQRRVITKRKLNVDIKAIEQLFETMEGTARYVEFNLYDIFSTRQPNIEMAKSDTLYQSYSYFKEFSFEEAQWLYKTGSTTYYYAIGFNTLQLLDQLKIDYQSKLFLNSISLEDILRTALCSTTK